MEKTLFATSSGSPRSLKRVARVCLLLAAAGFLVYLGIKITYITRQGIETDAVVTWWDRCRAKGRKSVQEVCVSYRFEYAGLAYNGSGRMSLQAWGKVGSHLRVRFVPSFPTINEPAAGSNRLIRLVAACIYGLAAAIVVIAWRWRASVT